MSETSEGAGWWQASDGKWYPPDQHPGQAPVPDDAPSQFEPAAPSQFGPSAGYSEAGYGQPVYGPPSNPYGYPPPTPSYAYGYAPGYQPDNGMGTAALVLGIIGALLFWFIGVSWILAALAIIFGILGIGKANRGEADNKGMAVAGVVCGSLVAAFWMVLFIVLSVSR